MRLLFLWILIALNLSAFDAFISSSKLKNNLDKSNVIIVDVADNALYKQGHISGAINFDVLDLFDDNTSLPSIKSQKLLNSELQKLGISSNSKVVIYSHNTDKGLSHSTLLALLLISNNFTNVTILDGGYLAWVFENELLIDTKSSSSKNGTFSFEKVTDILVNYQYLEENRANAMLIDSRAADYYYGIKRSKNTELVGHISNAKSHYYKNNFLTDGLIRERKELEMMFINGAEIKINQDIIIYSNSIFSASINWYILYHHMGFKKTKVYDVSTSEWSNYPQLSFTKFKWE